MRYVCFELGAVALFNRLSTIDGPYDFFLCPCPAYGPSRFHEVPERLEVEQCYNCLGSFFGSGTIITAQF
jgi:hypothetical protein